MVESKSPNLNTSRRIDLEDFVTSVNSWTWEPFGIIDKIDNDQCEIKWVDTKKSQSHKPTTPLLMHMREGVEILFTSHMDAEKGLLEEERETHTQPRLDLVDFLALKKKPLHSLRHNDSDARNIEWISTATTKASSSMITSSTIKESETQSRDEAEHSKQADVFDGETREPGNSDTRSIYVDSMSDAVEGDNEQLSPCEPTDGQECSSNGFLDSSFVSDNHVTITRTFTEENTTNEMKQRMKEGLREDQEENSAEKNELLDSFPDESGSSDGPKKSDSDSYPSPFRDNAAPSRTAINAFQISGSLNILKLFDSFPSLKKKDDGTSTFLSASKVQPTWNDEGQHDPVPFQEQVDEVDSLSNGLMPQFSRKDEVKKASAPIGPDLPVYCGLFSFGVWEN